MGTLRMATAALVLVAALGLPSAAQQPKPVSFSKDVMPIFKASCLKCHKADKKKGKLDMSTYAALMKGGEGGAPVQAGDPDKSLLISMIFSADPKTPPDMPEEGPPLKKDQVDLISRWIKEGAKND